MTHRFVAVLSALLLLPATVQAQQSLEFRNVCGGTTFVFCSSVRLEQTAEGSFYFELGVINESGGGRGYRGSVITEVRFEGVDRPDRDYAGGLDGNSWFHPGPLHTDFLGGEVVDPSDWYGFVGDYTSHALLGVMSFRNEENLLAADRPPWSVDYGVASSCGEDLFDPADRLFVSATCGLGSGLIRTRDYDPYDREPDTPWTWSYLEDWDGLDEEGLGEDPVPTYDFRSAGLTIVAQDVADPSRVSICRLGSSSCALVTPEPGSLPLASALLGFLALVAYRRREA